MEGVKDEATDAVKGLGEAVGVDTLFGGNGEGKAVAEASNNAEGSPEASAER